MRRWIATAEPPRICRSPRVWMPRDAKSCVRPLIAALFKPRAVMEIRGSSAHQLVDSSIQLYLPLRPLAADLPSRA